MLSLAIFALFLAIITLEPTDSMLIMGIFTLILAIPMLEPVIRTWVLAI